MLLLVGRSLALPAPVSAEVGLLVRPLSLCNDEVCDYRDFLHSLLESVQMSDNTVI